MSKTPAMGRGLSSLMGNLELAKPIKNHTEIPEAVVVGSIAEISIDDLDPNPENPRKTFSDEYLHELARSIESYGIIQPITVRKKKNRYQIISGECRYRASKLAGLKTMPAYIRLATDVETLEMAVTENIQRKDLNPIEIAINYKALMDGLSLTQDKLSEKLGKSRSAIANQLRLLKLPAEIQLALQDNEDFTVGHARALIALESDEKRIETLHKIIKDGWSVRQVEEFCKKPNHSEKQDTPPAERSQKTEYPHEDLSQKLGTAVKYKISKSGRGHILIEFSSEKELARIVSLLK